MQHSLPLYAEKGFWVISFLSKTLSNIVFNHYERKEAVWDIQPIPDHE
jgi:hypothetical protein